MGPWVGFLLAAGRKYTSIATYYLPSRLRGADTDPNRYDEGITVLYGSNTFHVRTTSMRMLGCLVPQIPATILSRITSVECVMDDLFISYKDYVTLQPEEKSEEHMLSRTVSCIPRLMPSLQKLYVGFWPPTCLLHQCPHGRGILQHKCTEHIASLWEAMAFELGQMGRSCDLELALPSTPFEQYHHEATMQGRRMGVPNWGPEMPSKFSYYPRLRLFQPARGRGPESELGTDEGGSDVGYWISMSLWDGQRPGVTCCFMEHGR